MKCLSCDCESLEESDFDRNIGVCPNCGAMYKAVRVQKHKVI